MKTKNSEVSKKLTEGIEEMKSLVEEGRAILESKYTPTELRVARKSDKFKRAEKPSKRRRLAWICSWTRGRISAASPSIWIPANGRKTSRLMNVEKSPKTLTVVSFPRTASTKPYTASRMSLLKCL